MYPRHSLAAGSLALLLAFPASAAETAGRNRRRQRHTLQGSRPRVPANISVISKADIRNTPAQSIPDVLGAQAGIFVSQLGGGAHVGRNATVDMRGFGATATSNTLILVDGQRG